uniref:EF-hand domain-containing protein n=1 Tax=Xiphophorus couchianus TaxID=32473 RepID=A0A3B5LND6_9TELE
TLPLPPPAARERTAACTFTTMASTNKAAEEEQGRLRSLFHTYDVDNSGRIEKDEFSAICQELQVPTDEAESIFSRLDADGDGTSAPVREAACVKIWKCSER